MRFWVALSCALLLAAAVNADRPREAGQPRPNLVKIEAVIGAAPSSSAGEARWIVNVHGRRMTLAVVHIVALTGDISEQQLLQTVKPRAVAFDLDGPPALLRQLAATAAGEHVAITGYVRLGSRHFAVSGLDPMTP